MRTNRCFTYTLLTQQLDYFIYSQRNESSSNWHLASNRFTSSRLTLCTFCYPSKARSISINTICTMAPSRSVCDGPWMCNLMLLLFKEILKICYCSNQPLKSTGIKSKVMCSQNWYISSRFTTEWASYRTRHGLRLSICFHLSCYSCFSRLT